MKMNATSTLRDVNWSSMAERRPLPIQFALYPSKRMSGTLCPCLIIRKQGIELIRILDPEHKQPFFSLDSIFLLAGLTIPSGILRFDLRRERGDYDLTLAGLEPREGIWAPFSIAQRVVTELNLHFALKTFFSFKHAWSLDEGEKNGLVHNWQVSNQHINPSSYSLATLFNHSFDTFNILSRGQQINTLIDKDERKQLKMKSARIFYQDEGENKGIITSSKSFEQRLLRWSVRAIEQLHDVEKLAKDESINTELNEQTSLWSPTSLDMLMLFADLPHCQDDSFAINDGQIVITKNQLREEQIQRTKESHVIGQGSDKFEAEIILVLIDSLWKWHIERLTLLNLVKSHQDEMPEGIKASQEQPESLQAMPNNDRLNRLESSIEDIRTILFTMQKRKGEQINSTLQRSENNSISRNPFININQSQFITPLLLGIVLGMILIHVTQ